MSTQEDLEAKRKLFERDLRREHPACKVTLGWIAGQLPYRYVVWLTELKPAYVVFDANEIVALAAASDDGWLAAFCRKLDRVLAEGAIEEQPMCIT